MKVVITGGAGFIGSNASHRHLTRGDHVVIVDNLCRPGAEHNVAWLHAEAEKRAAGHALTLARVDVANPADVDAVFAQHADTEVILHLAGQVAVTTSVVDPYHDFRANALGTLHILEAARRLPNLRALVFASTNKVYGHIDGLEVRESPDRYDFAGPQVSVSESQPLDFHSPYGCSKGAADQYTVDYARVYGLPTVTVRQSCIYGPRQLGIEDQGWVAWFCIAAVLGKPITIYGDGKQVRDILYVDDLLDFYDSAIRDIDHVRGRVFNIGGGPSNSLSLRELLTHLEFRLQRPLLLRYDQWRVGDQRVYISDITRATRETSWSPKIPALSGVDRLLDWVQANRHLFGRYERASTRP